MAHDAKSVANFLLDRAEDEGTSLTVMTLLKIIYFSHGWHLARSGEPLVKNSFEAWEYGPVVRSVYECFHDAGSDPIKSRATRFDPATGQRELVSYAFTEDEASLLNSVFKAYSRFDAFRLSAMTHEPGSPWDRVWNAPNRKVTLGMRIPDAMIRDYFLNSRWLGAAH